MPDYTLYLLVQNLAQVVGIMTYNFGEDAPFAGSIMQLNNLFYSF
jgi:hypothetical protein